MALAVPDLEIRLCIRGIPSLPHPVILSSRAEPKTCPERTRRRRHGAVTAELNLESISRMGHPSENSIKLSCGGNAFTRRRCCPADMGCFDSVRLPPHFAQHDRGGRFATAT